MGESDLSVGSDLSDVSDVATESGKFGTLYGAFAENE